VGQTERANKTIQQALQIAQKIEATWRRSSALSDIAIAMAEAGQAERANETFQLALQAAQKIEDTSVRSWALRCIAKAMAEAGQIDLAVEVAETIDDPVERFRALAAIMAAKRGKGEAEKQGEGETGK
jgi:serine protease Do